MTSEKQAKDEPTIPVDATTHQRFEKARQRTATEHAPAMDPATFLNALLDTEKAVREGYYDD